MEKQAGRFTCEHSISASFAHVENSSKPGPIPREQKLPAPVVSLAAGKLQAELQRSGCFGRVWQARLQGSVPPTELKWGFNLCH